MTITYLHGGGGAKPTPGFTLAEILITLGIIGVVAALTMPALVAKHQEKVAVTKLKKAYSALSQAYLLAQQENGEISGWFTGTTVSKNSETFFNNMKPYLKISKECGSAPGCMTSGFLKNLHGSNYNNYDNSTEYKFILADGAAIIFYVDKPGCTGDEQCGNIKIDIDGFQGPYTWGKDAFVVVIKPNKLVPEGIQDSSKYPFSTHCNMSSTANGNGVGCTAWVIYNENMDYLHCDNLSWDGPTKCD
jgi:prepilin-type N-terminal cleavage/methylation domain-containing protein